MRRYSIVPLCLACGMLPTIGCQPGHPPTYPVEGRLIYSDSTPVPGRATVAFFIEIDGQEYHAFGRVGEDGRFRMGTQGTEDGAVAGEHRVAVRALPGAEDDSSTPVVAEQYSVHDTSGLTATVQADQPNSIVLTIDRPTRSMK